MEPTDPTPPAPVDRSSPAFTARVALRLLGLLALPMCCCVFAVWPAVTTRELKPKMESFCADVAVGEPVADVQARARHLGLAVVELAGATSVEVHRGPVSWYCKVDHAGAVVRAKRAYGHTPWD